MSFKKYLFPSLLVGLGLSLIRDVFTKPTLVKPAARDASYDAIDAYVEQQRCRLRIPGISLAIVEGDQIVHLRGFGHARPGGKAPSPHTPFLIGSLTKSFTALAIMQLVETGKVELDAPVQRYLPWFWVADVQASAQMTVRHLLNQTSGLPTLPGELCLADFDDSPAATERQVRALATLKLTSPVGSKCQYSNLNYNILGLIIEVTSGESYADYIQNHIFTPLGMSHSYTAKAGAQQYGLAMGHRHWFSLPFPAPNMSIPPGSLPSGQLISCTEDMAHYLIAHLNGGCYDDVQILSANGIETLHQGVEEYKVWGISSGKYGMGWFDIDISQTKTFSHGGNVPDFSAFMALVPEQKRGLVLLANADPYGLPPVMEEVGLNLTALLAGQPPASIKLDFIQWMMRLLPLLPLAQAIGVFATKRRIRRWHQNPVLRPSRSRIWRWHILLPLLPNLGLGVILIYLQSSRLLGFLRLFMPDLAWVMTICGRFSLIWSFLRTGLMLWALRQPKPA